jgi:hypothetical protein
MEVGAFRNLDSFGSHQAGQRCLAPKVNTIACVHVSEHSTEDNDFASRDIGKNLGMLPYRDPAVGDLDDSFDFTLYDQ